MKNRYEVRGEVTVIFIETRKGLVYECLIDTVDLPKVKLMDCWHYHSLGKGKPGYVSCKVIDKQGKRRTVLLHRYLMDCPDGMVVDHIYHNPLDNRRSQLREITPAENMQNKSGAYKCSQTGVRGVTWDKQNQKYRVQMWVDGRYFFLGRFDDLAEAKAVAEAARAKHMPYSEEATNTKKVKKGAA